MIFEKTYKKIFGRKLRNIEKKLVKMQGLDRRLQKYETQFQEHRIQMKMIHNEIGTLKRVINKLRYPRK